MIYALALSVGLIPTGVMILASTDYGVLGLMTSVFTALLGLLGVLVKAMSDRLDAKDAAILEIGTSSTKALTESSDLLRRVLERLDEESPRPRRRA